jgi:DNA-directed RNA polymerase specialized sigma24 family protein
LRLQGLNDREIGEALGRNHGAIRTAQYRMVLKLRECIDQPRPSSIQKEATHVER